MVAKVFPVVLAHCNVFSWVSGWLPRCCKGISGGCQRVTRAFVRGFLSGCQRVARALL